MKKRDQNGQRQASRPSVTIQDVAGKAGVSTATVSRTLANPDVVSAKTRERVIRAVTETGYTPNVAARNLRARRSMMILVIVPNVANPYFAEVLRGIDDELVVAGYDLIIGNLDNLVEREARYVKLAQSGQVDGVLIMSGRIPQGNGRSMADLGLPMTALGAAIPGLPVANVVVDDHKASCEVAEQFLGLGHRRFGYISGPAGNVNEKGRYGGFLERLSAAGLGPKDITYWQGHFNLQAGIEAAKEFLALDDRPTAIFAACDEMAISFMKTVITAGLRVPEDVSVVGFDGIEISEFVSPTLTTMRQPRHELGRLGARTLLEEIAGEASGERRIELIAPLVLGESMGPAKAS